jgi:nickel/cobalt transporter (NicO) family protein
MWHIFFGSLFLSSVHVLIPNHWIPLVAIAKTEKLTKRETFIATIFTGFSHSLSTIILGVFVGFAGIKLSESYGYFTKIAAPAILFVIGLIYLLIDIRESLRHQHNHHHSFNNKEITRKKTKFAIVASLCLAMFLTPCIEIEAYYFQASTIGWTGIIVVSTVYMLITLITMSVLVNLGLKGANKFNSHFLEHHEKLITGIILIILAFISFFVTF